MDRCCCGDISAFQEENESQRETPFKELVSNRLRCPSKPAPATVTHHTNSHHLILTSIFLTEYQDAELIVSMFVYYRQLGIL